MDDSTLKQAHYELLLWCRKHDFAGYDPYDALNSRLFQVTPLKHSRIARLAWTQLCKRSPVNLRSLALVPPQKNSKGTALFALAALASFRRMRNVETETEARQLLDELLQMQIAGYGAWGYNFDWQSRNFFAPRETPTIVPTAFAVRALVEGYEAFHDDRYLQAGTRAAEFILQDLKSTSASGDELCFSYSPVDNTQIFNASLLAAETLASVGALTGESDYCRQAIRAARFVTSRQRNDGSWTYGVDESQEWVDSFHSAYVLFSLSRVMRFCGAGAAEFEQPWQRGYDYWRESFFLADGWPKYYHDTPYPADVHSAATAIVTLLELRQADRAALPLAEKIASWAIRNLRDDRGYFYYQRRRFHTVRTPFMRWSQSWMLYALARLLEEKSRNANC